MGPSCGWGGFATTGKTSMSTEDGTVSFSVAAIRSGFVNLATIGHELGHNFGNHHAGFYDCGSSAIAKSGCAGIEYGDVYDILGKGNTGHLNALHKEYIGWLDSTNIKNIKESGTYIIEPIETVSSGLKAIKIQRGINDFLFAEYRRPIGYDSGLDKNSSNVFKGALLHIRMPGEAPNRTALLDPTPPGDAKTAALLPGLTFRDPASGAQVTAVSLNNQALTLRVTAGRTDFAPPDIVITYPSGQPTVSGTITVKAVVTHPSPINRVEFYYIKDGAEVNFGKDTLSPYEAKLDTGILPAGINYIQARAVDFSGNEGISNIAGFFAVRTDSEYPRVELTSPADNDTLINPVKFSARATDDTGIDYVYFKLDQGTQNAQVFSDRRSPYEVQAGYLSPGIHTVYAEALDASGKTSKTTIVSFTVPAPEEIQGTVIEKPVSKQPKRETAPKLASAGIILPSGIVGSEYRAKLSATTTLAMPYEWNIPFGYGNFPTGLNLNRETGVISGIPTKEGVWNFTAKIIAQNGKTETRDFSIEIKPALVIKTEDLPLGLIGAFYKALLAAGGGGIPPYTWSIPNEYGALPPGLSIEPKTGVISGTPSKEGVWNFAIKIADLAGFFAVKDFSIQVEPGLKITTASLATGTVGVFYSETLRAQAKNPPVSWNIPTGSGYGDFPPGLNLDASSGYISGVPSKEGNWSFSVKLEDQTGAVATKELFIKIRSGFIFEPDTLAEATVGSNYSAKLSVRGGEAPYVWKVNSGNLPQGLTLDSSSGLLSGVPQSKGYHYFTLKATDSAGDSGFKNFYINVKEPSALKILSPNGGEKLTINSPYEIKWSSSQVYSPVSIQVKDSSTGEIIFEKKDVYNSGSYKWTPTGVNPIQGAKVIINVPDLKLTDESDADFSIEVPTGAITLRGRLVNSLNNAPLENVEISGPNSADQYTTIAKTNKNGEFAFFTSQPADSVSSFYRSFSYSYSCYGNTSFSMQRNEGVLNIWTYPFEPAGQGWRKFPVAVPETILGDITFWPEANIKITSDIPVKFGLEYPGGKSGTGVSEYKTTHYSQGWSIIPLNYDIRIKLTDASGNVYYSPFVKFSPQHGCDPVTLNFAGGQFTWGPDNSIAPPSITTQTLPSGSIGTGISYNAALNASGGVTPYSWNVVSGSLPDGLSLNSGTGLISGIPLSAGVFNFIVKVEDARGAFREDPFTIEIKTPGQSSLAAPTALGASWTVVYRNNTTARTIAFQYLPDSVSGVSSFRFYAKKPGDSSFNFLAEFTGISSANCNSNLVSGRWFLRKEQTYRDGTWQCGLEGKWTIDERDPATYQSYFSPSYYGAGEYNYYIVAVDANGDVSPPSSTMVQHFLEPLTILSPTESQSPISGTTTFQWTVASGWPAGAKPYQTYVFDGSSYVWGRTGLDLSGSKIYDGPVLDSSKKYTAHVYGSHTASDKTSYLSVDVATTTFWITQPTGLIPQSLNLAGMLEAIRESLESIRKVIERLR